MNEFLAMGGYALYVWPAYSVALVVLAGVWATGERRRKRVEQQLAALENNGGADRP